MVQPNQVDLTLMQRYIADVAITPSALRGLGAKGFVEAAQHFLAGIDLKPLGAIDPAMYPGWLDCETQELTKAFPVQGLWGPARKCINIFMVMAALNRFLCSAYMLDGLEDALEVPLDNRVAGKVLKWAKKTDSSRGELPKWTRIKTLDPENSGRLQKLAAEMARERGIPRGRLDIALWPKDGLTCDTH
jgi:hypothetical protein